MLKRLSYLCYLSHQSFPSLARRVECKGARSFGRLLRAQVGDAHVPFRVEQHVLRLEVAVDDLVSMQVVERREDLCGIEERTRLLKTARRLQMVEELAAVTICTRRMHVAP